MTRAKLFSRSGVIAMIASIMIFSSLTGCKSESIDGHWQDKKIVVDGKIDDWEGVPTKFFEKQEAVVAMCNDDSDLYIIFRFRDPALARAIRRSGLTVWLDNEGGSNKDFGLKYNGAPEMDFGRPEGMLEGMLENGPMGGGRDRFADMEKKNPVQLMLIDKNSIFQEAIIPTDGREGPAVACDTSMSFFTYEFKIPLMKSELNYYGINAAPGQKIAVGAVWGGMGERGDRGIRPSGGMGGGMPGGGGGMPGGGMPGGGGGRPGGGPPGGGKQAGMQEQEVWLKTTLATAATVASEE